MTQPPASLLDEFNRQALLCQDEAFTLACDLLGDDTRAASILESAFAQAFQHLKIGTRPLRLEVLSRVVEACWQCPPVKRAANDLLACILPEPERAVLYLVDHLGLSYGDAAIVLHCGVLKIARRLALARWKIAKYDRITLRNTHAQNANFGGRR